MEQADRRTTELAKGLQEIQVTEDPWNMQRTPKEIEKATQSLPIDPDVEADGEMTLTIKDGIQPQTQQGPRESEGWSGLNELSKFQFNLEDDSSKTRKGTKSAAATLPKRIWKANATSSLWRKKTSHHMENLLCLAQTKVNNSIATLQTTWGATSSSWAQAIHGRKHPRWRRRASTSPSSYVQKGNRKNLQRDKPDSSLDPPPSSVTSSRRKRRGEGLRQRGRKLPFHFSPPTDRERKDNDSRGK